METAGELSVRLWEERSVLDKLAFKLEEQRLVLASGRHHWLEQASREVQDAVGLLDQAEQERATVSSRLACELGLWPHSNLETLASALPNPWDELMLAHRAALAELLAKVQRIASVNKELLLKSQDVVAAALGLLGSGAPQYGRDGGVCPDQVTPLRLLDMSV